MSVRAFKLVFANKMILCKDTCFMHITFTGEKTTPICRKIRYTQTYKLLYMYINAIDYTWRQAHICSGHIHTFVCMCMV